MFDKFGTGVRKADRKNKPAPGTHVVAITNYEVFKSNENGNVPRVTYRIVESTVDPVGAERGDIWFIHSSGYSGKFAIGEATDFVRAVAASLGHDPENIALVQQLGAQLAEYDASSGVSAPEAKRVHFERGVLVRVKSEAAKSAKGNDCINTSYSPVDDQTEETIKSRRAWCEKLMLEGEKQPTLPSAPEIKQAPMTFAAPAPSATPATNLLGMLGGK